MRPTIEIKYPDGRRDTVDLVKERTIIGRSKDADIRVNDNRVSREHCALELKGDKVYVVDLGGGNGTWIGSTRILANVREPFPHDAVVHVGPAQLRHVTTTPNFDPQSDLESQAFQPVAPQRPSRSAPPPARSTRPAAAAPAGPVGQSAASLESTTRKITMNPGERSSMQLSVVNQSKIVDHYTLSLVGVPATWVTLPTGGLELLPRQTGTLNIDFHPPRSSRTTAGIHRLNIAMLNKQGQVVSQTTAELEILPFDELVVDVRPNPYQSRSGGTLILTVENHGNADTNYRIDVIEPSDSLNISVDPQTASVAPQQSRESYIQLRPRKRNWFGSPNRLNMTTTVTSSRQSATVSPVYTQLSTFPRWLPILALLACCVLIPLFFFLALPEITPLLTPEPTITNTPENTATPTPDMAATQTATRAIWLEGDDDGDGLTNGEEIESGTLYNSKDTDGDGLSDFDELKRHGTDPTNQDSDGDTVPDGEEASDPCLSPISPDTDLDGMRDDIDPDSCTGVTPTPSPVPDFALGGQVNNSDKHLDVLEEARMSWVKVQLRFGLGADASSTVQDAAKFKEKGFKVLLSVVGNKEELQRGGGYNQAFADFLGQIAPVADGIEVWNEPNIQNEWPVGEIDPADYTELLRLAYDAIKANNPRTLVISAAPAPTGVNNETVMSDDRFIQGMMAAGARNFLDCVGIHYNAGATPPSATSGHPSDSTGHYSYYFIPMVDLYFDTFNPDGSSRLLPLCFTEIGYLSADGFDQTLAQAGANNFIWAEGTSVRDQAAWLEEALLRSCRSGKVKLFIVWNVDFENYGQDPQAGYAIFRPNEKCPSCDTLSRAVGLLRNEGCMR